MPVLAALALLLATSSSGYAADTHDAVHDAHRHAEATPASSAGAPGDPARAARTIDIRMTDNMRFDPSRITVKRGETVRFRVANAGKLEHEMVIGTGKELQVHAAMMREHAPMEHGDDHMVAPGTTRDIVWRFAQPGRFKYACLVPGHFEAGMVGDIDVR